ncbi:MAG TPA: Crp/Fnr family transcriptional regulator [Vicinamibacterales bacterium]|nr:Crp/Fnr family transcriptional regulator [Vicinamibacterales bacterium]
MRKVGATDARAAPSLRAVPFLKTAADTDTIVLTSRQRDQLMLIATRLRLPARTIVYREGAAADSVFAVMEGVVKSYRDLPSGKRELSAFLFQRDLFGLSERGRYVNCTQAVTRVTLYRLSLSQLTLLLKRDGDLQFQFLAKVTHELREAQRRAVLINRRDAAGRLAMFIELMAARRDGSTCRELEVPLPMSRTDIADYLGLSRESVSRAARELLRRHLVHFENTHLVRIVDPTGLAKIAAAV